MPFTVKAYPVPVNVSTVEAPPMPPKSTNFVPLSVIVNPVEPNGKISSFNLTTPPALGRLSIAY